MTIDLILWQLGSTVLAVAVGLAVFSTIGRWLMRREMARAGGSKATREFNRSQVDRMLSQVHTQRLVDWELAETPTHSLIRLHFSNGHAITIRSAPIGFSNVSLAIKDEHEIRSHSVGSMTQSEIRAATDSEELAVTELKDSGNELERAVFSRKEEALAQAIEGSIPGLRIESMIPSAHGRPLFNTSRNGKPYRPVESPWNLSEIKTAKQFDGEGPGKSERPARPIAPREESVEYPYD